MNEASMFDVKLPDGNQPHPEGFVPDSPVGDAGDGGIFDSGLVGHCSPVNGPACDLVKQNCKKGTECVLVGDPDAALGATTACLPTQPSENRPVGSTCCPNAPSNQCDPGTTCIGNPCVDGGAPTGECAPACCPATADGGAGSDNCGTSPEGYVGECNINLINGTGGVLYTACTYSSKCIALGVAPCGPGFECIVENEAGSSECFFITGVDGGSPPGGSCNTSDCAPGLGCIDLSMSDGGTCLWQCHVTGQATPFDAGLLNGTVGHGGCPAGTTCEGIIGYPAWLGACIP